MFVYNLPLQAQAVHVLQVPREGDQRHRRQRVQRGVGAPDHPAGRSAPSARGSLAARWALSLWGGASKDGGALGLLDPWSGSPGRVPRRFGSEGPSPGLSTRSQPGVLTSSVLRTHGQAQEAASVWGGLWLWGQRGEAPPPGLGWGQGPGPSPHPHCLFLCRSWGGR